MKNKVLFTLLLFMCAFKMSFSQVIGADKIINNILLIGKEIDTLCDEFDTVDITERIISNENYKKYFDEYFTYLSYNRGSLPTGTSASLELANKETMLNLNISKKVTGKTGRILLMTAGIAASLDENVATLFSGNEIESGTTFFGNFAFLPRNGRTRRLKYVTDYIDKNGQVVSSPLNKLNEKRREFNDAFCQKYKTVFLLKYKCLIDRWVVLNNTVIKNLPCPDILAVIEEKEGIEKSLKDAGLLDKDAATISEEIIKQYQDDLYALEIENEGWMSVRFFWYSGGITYTRETYNTYNNNEPFAKRFSTSDFNSVGLKFAVHWFKEKLNDGGFIRSSYFNLNYDLRNTNNFAQLKSKDVLRTINKGQSTDTTYVFQSVRSSKDITNTVYKENWKHSFGSTYTAMFGKDKNVGVNLQAQAVVSPLSQPTYNTHAGVLLRLLNNNHDPSDKKSKARVNFELFIEFPDMTDVAATNKSVWENSVIGINTSLPFEKIFFK